MPVSCGFACGTPCHAASHAGEAGTGPATGHAPSIAQGFGPSVEMSRQTPASSCLCCHRMALNAHTRPKQ